MKANELRIGNLFNPEIPTAIEAWMLLPESKVAFKPVPLTEEWLLKFGFRKNNPNGYYIKGALYLGSGIAYLIHDEDSLTRIGTKIKYVHQLQNLYFTLTGEELTDKPQAQKGLKSEDKQTT